MKNHVKVKINGILNNSLFKITMIILCCLILSTSIIRTDNFINCMFNGLVILALLINIYHLPIVNDYIKNNPVSLPDDFLNVLRDFPSLNTPQAMYVPLYMRLTGSPMFKTAFSKALGTDKGI